MTAPRRAPRPTTEQVWSWLAEVPDPEIPVISIVDLGIVRDVRWSGDDAGATCVVVLTPTYSGCPATEVIAASVLDALRTRGLADVTLETRLAPAWTTDWLSDQGRTKLRDYGIAPPSGRAQATEQVIRVGDIGRVGRGARAQAAPPPACPRCGSSHVELTSAFGSTPCKALYRCLDCREPFDHFKPH